MTDNPIPTLGRIVLAIVDPSTNNGADLAPAVITRVWWTDDCSADHHLVNYRVLSDGICRLDSDWKTSARLYADEAAARAALDEAGGQRTGLQAFWPPRGAKARDEQSRQPMVEIGGVKMTAAQFDAARHPLLHPHPPQAELKHVSHDPGSAPVRQPAQGPDKPTA